MHFLSFRLHILSYFLH